MNVAFNMDCMEGMKQYPDKYFDLAVVDPPYGSGSQISKVERERERERNCTAAVLIGNTKSGQGLVGGSTSTISRTGGTWSRKYQRERQGRRVLTFAIGTLPRRQNTFKNWTVFQRIKSFGAGTTSTFLQHGVFSFGES